MNGFDCFFEGVRLIFRPGIRAYVIIPFVLNTIVLTALVAWGAAQYDALESLMTGWLPEWAAFLADVLAVIAAIVIFVVFLFVFAIIANVISSPFLALLSEKVEETLTGRRPDASSNLIVVAVRALGREAAKLLYYLPRLIGVFLLTLIPLVNFAAPVIWVLFGAWMMAIQYTDFAADNNEVSFRDLRERLARNRFQATLFGLLAYLTLALPVVNLILIPASVAGGTVFWVERLRRPAF